MDSHICHRSVMHYKANMQRESDGCFNAPVLGFKVTYKSQTFCWMPNTSCMHCKEMGKKIYKWGCLPGFAHSHLFIFICNVFLFSFYTEVKFPTVTFYHIWVQIMMVHAAWQTPWWWCMCSWVKWLWRKGGRAINDRNYGDEELVHSWPLLPSLRAVNEASRHTHEKCMSLYFVDALFFASSLVESDIPLNTFQRSKLLLNLREHVWDNINP